MDQHEKDKKSEFYHLFLEVREFLLGFEGIHEMPKPRITTYHLGKKGICHMRTMPNGLDIGFLKGARFEDKWQKLSGNGKAIRVLTINTFNRNLIEYYLKQALSLVEN